MKKKVFLCVIVSFVLFETIAKDFEPQEQLGVVDFLFGRSPKNAKPDDKQKYTNQTKDRYQVDYSQKNESKQIEQNDFPDQFSAHSDQIVETSVSGDEKREDEYKSKTNDKNEIDEALFNSFRNISHISDFLKKIQVDIECLSSGKIKSNADWNRLIQKKQKISTITQQCIDSILAYDKICAIEKIVMDYNSISDISVYFLSDIDKTEINQMQNAFFLTEVDSLSDKLAHAFNTPIGNDLQKSIEKLHEEVSNYEIKDFYEKLLLEIKKIPNELVESDQKEKIDQVLQKIDDMKKGASENKYSTLQDMLKSYNDLRTSSFKLKKISYDDVKNLLLEMTEDLFFAKMLNSLSAMNEEGYSHISENDAEVVAALNIKKSVCKMLGGSTYSGTRYNSSIERFRTTDSLRQKQSLLKDAISQFNKTVNLFKVAVKSLKEEGRSLKKLKDIDSICTIDENIDKIFEKIAIYSGNLDIEDGVRTGETRPEKSLLATVDGDTLDSEPSLDSVDTKTEEESGGELI